MKVLIIGSGGREHAIVWKIAQSKLVKKIYCASGNGGTSLLAQNINIACDDIKGLGDFAVKEKIDLTIVGPEAPLVEGIVDKFEARGLNIFGPSQKGALLEGSKVFAKQIMKKYSIPTADFAVFDKAGEAKEYVRSKGVPIVIKADGLAAGKGVFVAKTLEEALSAVDAIMVKKEFGGAGVKIVVEECLTGQEASILAFTDGKNIMPLVASQDHKRIFDGDRGPNTGGMGAYAPAPLVDSGLLEKIIKEVFKPLLNGLRKEKIIYKGVIYAGMMINAGQISVLEFNCRFGDPETQVILPKMKSDLVKVAMAVIRGKLKNIVLRWDKRFCISVVLASAGYPGPYEKNKEIYGLEVLSGEKDVLIFHAGTKLGRRTQDGNGASRSADNVFLTNGGRVIDVTALGSDIQEARKKVYEAIKKISFEGMHYRKDIANQALQL